MKKSSVGYFKFYNNKWVGYIVIGRKDFFCIGECPSNSPFLKNNGEF